MLRTAMLESQNKRRRLDNDDGTSIPLVGNNYGDTTVGGQARVLQGTSYDTHYHIHGGSRASQTTEAMQPSVKDLVHSLRFKNIDSRFHNIQPALAKTCQWLFRHQTYLSWNDETLLKEHKGFLWIKGNPGTGKSTIMKAALQRAKRNGLKNNYVTISYFFNARASADLEKSTLGLHRSLVYQVLQAIPALLSVFDEMFSWKRFDASYDWTVAELQGFLIDVIKIDNRSPICIFIDALDEGNDEDVRMLVSFLEDLTGHAGGCPILKICLSSRHYPHITIRKGLSLVVEAQKEHHRDIEVYVAEKLIGVNAKLRAELCRKSTGIFLWVVLVVPILSTMHDQAKGEEKMMKYLQSLPGDLEGVFAEILRRDPNGYQECVSLLQWVLYSTRPLSSTELYLAVQYSWVHADQEKLSLPGDDMLKRFLVHNSHGLVELTRSEPRVAQFIHETVREFLVGKTGLCQLDSSLNTNLIGWSHAKLAQACLCYLSCHICRLPPVFASSELDYSAFSSDLVKDKFPFVEYVISNILSHAEAAEQSGVSQTSLLNLIKRDGVQVHRQWRHLRNLFEKHKIRRYDTDVTLLYAVVDMKLPNLAEVLAKDRELVNIKCGRYGTALQCACRAGCEDIVLCLLEHGADITMRGGEHKMALHAATAAKSSAVLKLLCRHGSLDSQTLYGALRACIQISWLGGVRVLTEAGAAHTREHPVLHEAVVSNRTDIANYLLTEGADANSFNAFNETPMMVAARNGSLEMIKLLVEFGVRVGDPDLWYSETALYLAVLKGHVKSVNLLLQYGSNPKILPKEEVGSMLHVAARSGSVDTVKLILEQGSDIHGRNYYGQTPLHVAIRYDSPMVANFLLDNGGDINLQDRHGNTPVHYAVSFRPASGVLPHALLSHGDINIWIRNSHGHSVVDCAVACSSLCVEQLFAYELLTEKEVPPLAKTVNRSPCYCYYSV